MEKCLILLSFFMITSTALPTQNAKIHWDLPEIHDDALLTVPQLIQKYGYPVEEHYLTTIDGYHLCLHRIPHGKTKKNPNEQRPIMFLQHGLLSSSADWVISGPEKGLAYLLANEGYDVWMGNFRGNSYSRNHTFLDPDRDENFWDFSWHEMGIRDLPDMIDYVLGVTGQDQLFHVGHSQGTTTFYVMGSELPEYNKKIRAHFSLAPVAFMGHITSPILKFLSNFEGGVEILAEMMGIGEFLPSNQLMALAGEVFCEENDLTHMLCTNALFAVCGFSPDQMNSTLLPILMGHTPAGSSVSQFLHYGQEIKSGKFRQWDYGAIKNLKYYKSLQPPDYRIENIEAPVYLIYTRNDWMSDEEDVLRLYELLPNAQGKFLVTDERFNHLDYMYGIDAPKYVYNKILSLATRH